MLDRLKTDSESSGRTPLRQFTLIELLVVIAVIAIIASLLLPALRNTMTTVRAVQCTNNTRQMAYAALMYADDNDSYLPTTGRWTVNWMVRVAPYLGCDRTFSSTKVNASGSPAKYVEVFNCPETRDWPHNYYPSGDYGYYWNISSSNTGNPAGKYVTPVRKMKWPSQTIIVGDCWIVSAESIGSYTSSLRTTYKHVPNDRSRHHNFRINFAFADGHARLTGQGEDWITYRGAKLVLW